MSAVVAAARAYLGTPFVHRGRTRRGLDCVGLAWCAFRDAGVVLEDYRLYGREPLQQDGLVDRIERAMGAPAKVAPVRPADLQAGDVIVQRFVHEPHHVSIVAPYRFGGWAVIHACGQSARVVEHRLSDDMIARITHVFRRPV